MKLTRLHIKNMVCPRCIRAVEQTLTEMQIPYRSVSLGTAIVEVSKTELNWKLLSNKLYQSGFELLIDKNDRLVEQIKTVIIDFIHHQNIPRQNISKYIGRQMGKDYSALSKIFSEKEGIGIEKYVILQKVEKIKELLTYDELTVSEIAYRLGYSSVPHLSAQFKKITGISPSQFKKNKNLRRRFIDQI